MYLGRLFDGIEADVKKGDGTVAIDGIASDSRKVRPGMAFFCLTGMRADGNDHAMQAVENGAVALITDREDCAEDFCQRTKDVTIILVKDARKALAHCCVQFYDHPARKLVTIGVTGTKGKTTCTYLIKSVLENAGRRVGLIGTNEVVIGRRHIDAENTTPDAILLQSYLRQMADEGLDTVVMEVSSQAIKLHRTDGILFDYGIFTNLSPDHVAPGEHRDFQEYLECKRELFRNCRIGVVNGDDPYVARITEDHVCKLEKYGLGGECRIRATDIERAYVNGRPGVTFRVTGDMDFEVRLPMPGKFSVYNALAAICLCNHFRVRESDVQRAMLAAKVKGRIECVLSRDGWSVLIDYAHNLTALASLLETLRGYHPERLICLFGCGGDRPAMRRRLMGKVSGEMADLTIVTDDNPRSEEPSVIREQIAEGVRETGGAYKVIPGREEAIRFVLSEAKKGDLIVLAGKGHETYQEIHGVKYPMDERKIIREIQDKACHTQT